MPKGTIRKLTSKPRGFILRVPPDLEATPPEPGYDATYTCDSDDLAVALAAFAAGSTVTVSGTPPACAGVAVEK